MDVDITVHLDSTLKGLWLTYCNGPLRGVLFGPREVQDLGPPLGQGGTKSDASYWAGEVAPPLAASIFLSSFHIMFSQLLGVVWDWLSWFLVGYRFYGLGLFL